MAEGDVGPSPTPAPAKRRFPFKKPDWAKALPNLQPQEEDEKEEEDFFSHSGKFSEIVADRERQRQLKLARKEKRREEKSRSREDDEGRETKRRRVSTEDEDADKSGSKSEPGDTSIHDSTSNGISSKTASSERRKKRNSSPATEPARKETIIIDLEDSDEVEELSKATSSAPRDNKRTVSNQLAPQDSDSDLDVDAELKKMEAQARERLKQRELQRTASAQKLYSSPHNSSASPATAPSAPDPIIKILIHSKIPGAKPLIVSRHLSQRLQEPREAWLARQSFEDANLTAATVFLTWRNRRLFDVQNLRSLGIEPNEEGVPIIKGKYDIEDDMSNVELEAVTEDIFKQNKRAAERGRYYRGLEDDEDEDDAAQAAQAHVEEKKVQTRIVLRAKGYEDYKLIVKPDTTFARIENAYCAQRSVPPDKRIVLLFDGDVLNPDETMNDTEIEDMDTIEVHIK